MMFRAVFAIFYLSIYLAPNTAFGQAQSQKPIEIGALLPLTGTFSDWGNGILKGLNFGLRDFSLIQANIQDDQCEGTRAVDATHMLLSKGIKVFFVACVASVKAIASIVQKADGVVFVLGGIDDETLGVNTNVVDLATAVSSEARYLAAYIASQPQIKKVGIIHGTNFFGEELGSELAKDLAARNRTVSNREKMDVTSIDCRAIALRILSQHPDAVFVHGSEFSSGQCIKVLRHTGFKGPLFAPYTIESESFLRAAGPAGEGVKYTFNSSAASKDSATLEWENQFVSEFGTNPISHALITYDGVRLLNESLNHCDRNESSCVLTYFKNLGKIDGIAGQVVFQSNGGALRPFGIKQIHDGKFQWVVDEVDLGGT
jgi:branched-chain amino acid transport system substrate-binding protein